MNHLGFLTSYTEVIKFEVNAAHLPRVSEVDTIQFVVDNTDHNTVTLDGHSTFHGMGIISVMTPRKFQRKKIPRRDVKLKDIATGRGRLGPRRQFTQLKKWREVDSAEMIFFFIGLVLLTGLVSKPSIESYWSTLPILYTTNLFSDYAKEQIPSLALFLALQ